MSRSTPTAVPDDIGGLSGLRASGQALPTGDLMTGFGDSVLSGTAPAIHERFPGIVLEVLVTTVGIGEWVPASNATLLSIAAEQPNAAVADWHAVVAADPSLLHEDRTHPNFDGIAIYADLIGTTHQQLGPQ